MLFTFVPNMPFFPNGSLLKKTHLGSHIVESLTGSYVGRYTGIRIGSHGDFGQGTHEGSRIGIHTGTYVGTCAMDYMTK